MGTQSSYFGGSFYTGGVGEVVTRPFDGSNVPAILLLRRLRASLCIARASDVHCTALSSWALHSLDTPHCTLFFFLRRLRALLCIARVSDVHCTALHSFHVHCTALSPCALHSLDALYCTPLMHCAALSPCALHSLNALHCNLLLRNGERVAERRTS